NGDRGISVAGDASTGTVDATIADSVAAGNGGNGFRVSSKGGFAQTNLLVVRSLSVNNAIGVVALVARGQATTPALRIGQPSLAGNAVSWAFTLGAVLESFGDNYVAGNFDGDPAFLATIAKK